MNKGWFTLITSFLVLSILVACSPDRVLEAELIEKIDDKKTQIKEIEAEIASVTERIVEIDEETEWIQGEITTAEELADFHDQYEASLAEEAEEVTTVVGYGSGTMTYEEFIAQPYIIEQYFLQGERAPYLVDYDARQAYEVYRRTHEKYNQIFSDED